MMLFPIVYKNVVRLAVGRSDEGTEDEAEQENAE